MKGIRFLTGIVSALSLIIMISTMWTEKLYIITEYSMVIFIITALIYFIIIKTADDFLLGFRMLINPFIINLGVMIIAAPLGFISVLQVVLMQPEHAELAYHLARITLSTITILITIVNIIKRYEKQDPRLQ